MKNEHLIAIDYGTQSVRVSIIDKNGKFLAFEQEKYDKPYFSEMPGYAEQDPNYYYNCMCKAAKRVTSKHPELLKDCLSISSTCFRDTPAFLDKDYKVVRPSIIWLDQRQAELKKKLPFVYNFLFFVSGMTKTIELNRKRTPAIWLQENEPENWKKIRYYAPLNSYLNYRLIGVLADSASNMGGHYPINFKAMKWYKKYALKGYIFNVDPSLMPPIVEVGETIGYITEKSHEETGFPVGLKYIASGNDKSCEALGCGQIDDKSAHISYGTSSSVATINKKYVSPELFLPAYSTCIKGYYTSEVQVYRGYWMLKWFVSQFGQNESLEANIEKIAPEEILNKKIMEISPGSDGLILQPYWGPGLRRPLAKGAIVGFYDVHTKYHLYRAIIEGIGYALKEGLLGIEKRSRKKIEYLTISGGGSRSDAICQITSDLFNLPVYKSETYENSSLGCAASQFVSLGVFKSLEEMKENMIRYTKKFEPNPEAVRLYKQLFEKVYIHLYPELKNSYKALTDLKEKENRRRQNLINKAKKSANSTNLNKETRN